MRRLWLAEALLNPGSKFGRWPGMSIVRLDPEARSQEAAQRVEEWITQTLAVAPPSTAKQTRHLRELVLRLTT